MNLTRSFPPRPRALLVALVASLALLCAHARVSAQQSGDASAAGAQTAAQLYDEAAGYTRRRYEELERAGFRYDAKLAAEVESEQRAVAARAASALAARAPLTDDDRFFLGQLQSLAGDSARAVETMRAFLAARPDAARERQQTARFVIALDSARLGATETLRTAATPASRADANAASRANASDANANARGGNSSDPALAAEPALEAAESALADFVAHDEPPAHDRRYRVEMQLAQSYRQRGERARAVEHARAAFEAAKRLHASAPLDAATRDEVFYRAGQFLSDALYEVKRTGEAIDALQELRRLSVSFPSADLYRRATLLLGRIVPAVGYMTRADDPLFDASAGARAAPEIEVKDWIDQKPTTLAAERGRVVLLDFWATWCTPCRAALPSMSDWQKRYRDRGLTIIAFTQYHDETVNGRAVGTKAEREGLREFRRENRLPFGVAAAESVETAARYNVTSIPAAVLIDRRGVVRYLSVGSSDGDLKELEQMIVRLLEEKP